MTRILTALVLIPIIVWAAIWAPEWAFLIVMGLVGVAAYREFDAIVEAHGVRGLGWLGAALGVAWLLTPERALLAMLAFTGVICIVASLRVPNLPGALTSAGCGILGIAYIFGAWRCGV